MVKASGAWPVTGTSGEGSQRWVAPVAEDPVEVLLRQHRAGRTPGGVEPLDDGREPRCRWRGRRSRTAPSSAVEDALAGTPLRSGRTPVIIITWLGMVSITGSERAFGYHVPAVAQRLEVGVRSRRSRRGGSRRRRARRRACGCPPPRPRRTGGGREHDQRRRAPGDLQEGAARRGAAVRHTCRRGHQASPVAAVSLLLPAVVARQPFVQVEVGRLVGAVADDEPVHLGSLRGDVEDREAVVVEVEVLDVRGCWP